MIAGQSTNHSSRYSGATQYGRVYSSDKWTKLLCLTTCEIDQLERQAFVGIIAHKVGKDRMGLSQKWEQICDRP